MYHKFLIKIVDFQVKIEERIECTTVQVADFISDKYLVRSLHLSRAHFSSSLLLFSGRERLFITSSQSTSSQVAVTAWREERYRNKNDSDVWKV